MLTGRKTRGSHLLKLSSSSVLLVPGLMYLKGAINADSILTFSGGETRDMQSQHEGSGGDVIYDSFIDQISSGLTMRQRHRQSVSDLEYAHWAGPHCQTPT